MRAASPRCSRLGDSDASVRQEAWGSPGRFRKNLTGDERRAIIADGQRSLSKAVESGNVEEQVIARSALATLGDSEQRTGLRKLAESSDTDTRRAVAEHSKDDQELLRRLLRDREFSVRFAAAQRLAEAGEPQAAAVLREGLARGGSDGLTSYHCCDVRASRPPPRRTWGSALPTARKKSGPRSSAQASRLPADAARARSCRPRATANQASAEPCSKSQRPR